METIIENKDTSPIEDNRAEELRSGEGEPEKEEDFKEEKSHPHHHAHPHILTIEYSNHGRTNAHSFGIDHEPGAGI